ncbi:hypothetical protein [Aquifex sp.]
MRILVLILLTALSFSFSKEVGFTQEDRERLIRLETTLKIFMEQTNKRFEELRQDMNARFEQIDKRFEQIDKRFEQIDKRFEQVNNRFNDMFNFLWILTGIFTTLTASVIAFAWWDRKTIIRKAKQETIEHLEREGKLRNLIEALREKAKSDRELAEILKKYGLM